FRPKLDNPNDPTVAGKEPGTYVANERYKNVPGAVLRFGNLPAMINADVHSGEDVVLTAVGPGSDRVRGQMCDTEGFHVMAGALGRGLGDGPRAKRRRLRHARRWRRKAARSSHPSWRIVGAQAPIRHDQLSHAPDPAVDRVRLCAHSVRNEKQMPER